MIETIRKSLTSDRALLHPRNIAGSNIASYIIVSLRNWISLDMVLDYTLSDLLLLYLYLEGPISKPKLINVFPPGIMPNLLT